MTTHRFQAFGPRGVLAPAPVHSFWPRAALTGLILLAFGGLSACGKAVAPKELKSARDAFVAAKAGPPAELAPAQLEEGRQALDRAEESFEKNKDKPETVDLAYVALRQIELAQSAAATEAARRDQVAAERDVDLLEKKFQEATEARLDKTEAQLAKERSTAERTAAELEKERKAREDVEKKLSAALMSLEKIAQVKEEARGVVITLSGSVLFASGKSELLPIAQSKLDDVAKAVKDQGYKKIIVEGHTDNIGTESNNIALSQRRAEAVRSYLITRGIESAKTTAIGIGESRPVADNSTAEGRANNRRVELVVTPES
ncbi:MAG: OmpA family protein [Polyangiaceae bacterium]|nr:OmpA family protein [Polyangiaceae bacterium]